MIAPFYVFLMKKNASTYEKLVDIIDRPDLGGLPDLVDATTQSDRARVYRAGVQNNEALAFTAPHTPTNYTALEALKDTETGFAVWFGGTEAGGVVTPDGSDGKYEFKGYLSVVVAGGGVNDPQILNVSIAPSTAIEKSS